MPTRPRVRGTVAKVIPPDALVADRYTATSPKEANQPNRIVFQMRKFGLNLPGYLELDFSDTTEGLLLTETLRIGLNGLGKIFDPFIKIVYGKKFYNEFKEHHKREWQNLSDILQ